MDSTKIATSTWHWGSDTKEQIEQSFSDIAKAGYKSFEAVYTSIRTFSYDVPAYKRLLDQYGVHPISFYFYLPDLTERNGFFQNLEKELEFVQALGVRNVCLAGTQGRPKSSGDLECELQMVQTFTELCTAHQITAAIHPHYQTYFMYEDEWSEILERVPEARFCPDTAHLILAGCDPERIFCKYADKICFVHFKDMVFHKGEKFPDGAEAYGAFRDLGEGNIHFRRLYQILCENGYTGIICSEFDNPPKSDFESAKVNLEYLKNLI